MKKVVVIGSGIAGLSISRMLSNRYEVEIVEKGFQFGGLIKCERIHGNLFHRVGGHVFNSRNKAVLDWFWSHFDRENEFLMTRRNAKILLFNKLVGYPIENYIYQLPQAQMCKIINELLDKQSSPQKNVAEYENFKDYLFGNFGEELYKIYFGPYNTKIWHTDLSVVPLEWLDGKLPMPDIREVILNNILRKEESYMVHANFYYACRDGSQFIVNRLAEGLTITCSYQVDSINITANNKVLINGGDRIADSIIYCGDVRELVNIIKIEDDALKNALQSVASLPSNGTSNVFCETDSNDISWLYLPEEKFKAHRIIYTGNFSATNNEGTNRSTCVVEFSGMQEEAVMLEELKLLPGNLKPLAFNFEPNSYIIQNLTTRADIAMLKDLLKQYNIYLLGRFAEWEYYNMDKCIEAAMDLNESFK